MVAYVLKTNPENVIQNETHQSFIGGKPRLPHSIQIPSCNLCQKQLTFFFQVSFPSDHPWSGLTLAVFSCTMCAHEDYTIPPMLPGTLKGIDIPQSFLETYQVNFRLLLFSSETADIRLSYEEKIKFKPWILSPTQRSNMRRNKIGGEPSWVLQDETPATYDGDIHLFFLMQIRMDFEFEIVDEAPPQEKLFNFPGIPPKPYYSLWNQNFIYFFGTKDHNPPLVYVLTQVN